jgi:predicted RNA binding protein YcfA (HicA-like mRNA interferase family)
VSKLAPLDYDKVVKALSRIGYVVNHQRGSHIVMQLVDENKYNSFFGTRKPEQRIVVPAHKPIGRGMIRTIIREADLSVSEFNDLT